MNLRQLEYFVAIAEEGQVTAAARRLHITQPPLSYELRSLEKELGAKLFIRQPRGVELTDAGSVLYQRATAILGLASSAVREVGDVAAGREGTLSIGIISSSGGRVPTKEMQALIADYPNVSLELKEGNTYEVLEMLRRGEVELGIVRTPFQADGLEMRLSEPEAMAAIMPAGFECGARDDAVGLEELAARPLVIYRRFERILRDLFEERGLDPFFACINDDARTTCAWASRGFGIGLVPESFLPLMNLVDAKVKRVDEDALVTRMALVWSEGRRLTPLAERLIALLNPAAQELPRP